MGWTSSITMPSLMGLEICTPPGEQKVRLFVVRHAFGKTELEFVNAISS